MGLFSSILKGTGFSFSWKRAVGLTALRSKASRRIGVPTSRQGVERRIGATLDDRSEERRVGKECRSRWSPYH